MNFKALINYCLGITGHEKNAVIHVGMKNLNSPPEKAYLEMEGLSYENVRSKNPALHFILSWRSYESPTNEQVDEAVEIALKELNLEDCQSLWALQRDTENLHVHVVVNRISPETFKAVRPAQGWTKKALERAARKIEFTQGWEIEQSGRYVVDSSGNIHEKIEVRADSKLSQKARDIEAHTGSESIERIAKREILPILESADSWKKLNSQLSEHGAYLERRGKGAVLHFCGTILKLSSVSRKCSLTQLEHRLGTYNTPDENIKISEKSFIKTSVVPDVKNSWQDYQSEKEKYLEAKKSAIKNLRLQQKLERESLHDVQKSKWQQELKSGNWKGKGRDLNYLRQLVSFIYKKEQLNLRDEQNQEMLKLKSHYLQRFPSFKKWLLEQEREEDYKKYRFPGAFILSPAQSGISSVELPKEFDLRNYFPRRGSGGSVLYCRAGKFTADFSDMGKRIVLNKKTLTEESVLSALQLANAKWGATQINGSDEYKALCVSVAVKHNLKIANPDLAAEVERQRKEQREKFFSYRPVTVEEIEKLNLVENPLIYVNPRKDNQSYKGKIVHVDQERGYCVQLVGQKSLFVHRLDKFEVSLKVGEVLKISYIDKASHVKVEVKKVYTRTRNFI